MQNYEFERSNMSNTKCIRNRTRDRVASDRLYIDRSFIHRAYLLAVVQEHQSSSLPIRQARQLPQPWQHISRQPIHNLHPCLGTLPHG